MSDHYKTLGISENSSIDEIKKAYRKLSLKYHPDKNQGSAEAVEMFQKISEAYEVIGNDEKKREYDTMKKNPFMRMDGFPGGFHSSMNGDMDDLLNNIFGGFGFSGMPGMPGGMQGGMQGVFTNASGFGPNIHIFRNGQRLNQMLEKPTPIIKNMVITMEQLYSGAKIPIEIERWVIENGMKVHEPEMVYVTIPQGIDDGEIIVLREKGNILSETSKGDVKVFIKVVNETLFKRSGLDLIFEKNITLKEALCGFSFEIKYLNGKSYTLNNNPGNIIPPEYKKLYANMGLTRGEHKGNIIIHFHVDFPETLTIEQIGKLSEIFHF
jgi:DnaJ-class molecular chaperone